MREGGGQESGGTRFARKGNGRLHRTNKHVPSIHPSFDAFNFLHSWGRVLGDSLIYVRWRTLRLRKSSARLPWSSAAPTTFRPASLRPHQKAGIQANLPFLGVLHIHNGVKGVFFLETLI